MENRNKPMEQKKARYTSIPLMCKECKVVSYLYIPRKNQKEVRENFELCPACQEKFKNE